MNFKDKRIVWFTADYFVDVDAKLVPYLRDVIGLNIDWVVMRGWHKTIQIPEGLGCRVYDSHYYGLDPRSGWEYRKLLKQMDVCHADLIYNDSIGMPYLYPILHRMTKKSMPIVHAAHNVIPYPVWGWKLKQFVKYIFKHNDYFQLFSKFTAEYFKKHYPKKSMFYCPMTFKSYGNVTTDKYPFDASKVNLLFFGNVVANKRLDLLIEAVKQLPADVKDRVHLNICGKCSNPESYKTMIGNNSHISAFFKRIDDEEVAELFTKSSYLMLPYEDVAQSGPHMIAYNYNLPVIASDIEGFAERVVDGENGFLFERNQVDSLIETIIKAACLSSKEYEDLKKNLATYATENFGLENVAQRYIDYFKSVVK